jgi:hypothetical protein
LIAKARHDDDSCTFFGRLNGYEGRIPKGGILVSVYCGNSEWTSKAKDILEETGAQDVASTGNPPQIFAKIDRPELRSTDVPDTAEYEANFLTHYQRTFGESGSRYENYSPAYQFGARTAGQERYRGKSFNDVESDLRRDYETSNPGSSWERMKDAVRYGWDRVTGKGNMSSAA